jgi:hypothetical protein
MPAIPERNLTFHLGQDDRTYRMGPTRERSRLHPVHAIRRTRVAHPRCTPPLAIGKSVEVCRAA